MTTVEKLDKVLRFLEKRAATIGYGIDYDSRYIDLCAAVTALDFEELKDIPAVTVPMFDAADELAKCICPAEYEIFEILFIC